MDSPPDLLPRFFALFFKVTSPMRGRKSQGVSQPISFHYAALVKGRNETTEDKHAPEEVEIQKK